MIIISDDWQDYTKTKKVENKLNKKKKYIEWNWENKIKTNQSLLQLTFCNKKMKNLINLISD